MKNKMDGQHLNINIDSILWGACDPNGLFDFLAPQERDILVDAAYKSLEKVINTSQQDSAKDIGLKKELFKKEFTDELANIEPYFDIKYLDSKIDIELLSEKIFNH